MGILAWKGLKSRLFSAILDESLTFLQDVGKHPEAYEDITQPITEAAVNVFGIAIGRLALDVQKDPEKYAKILKPILTRAVKEGAGQMMPKMKWQDMIGLGVMALMQRFMGGVATGATGAAAEAGQAAIETVVKNPFL